VVIAVVLDWWGGAFRVMIFQNLEIKKVAVSVIPGFFYVLCCARALGRGASGYYNVLYRYGFLYSLLE
jgi:hypothetical protein